MIWEHRGRRFEVGLEVPVSTEVAWRTWARPEELARWFCDRAEGEVSTGSRIALRFDDFEGAMVYRVAECDPGRALVLTMDAGAVEIRFAPTEGGCRLTLIQSGFPDGAAGDEAMANIESGWRMTCALWREYVTNHLGRDKTTALVMRPTQSELWRLRPLYNDPGRLYDWLGVDIARFGPVLVNTGREVAWRWGEVDGVLECKAWTGAPGERFVGLRATAWQPETERDKLKARLSEWIEALEKLLIS